MVRFLTIVPFWTLIVGMGWLGTGCRHLPPTTLSTPTTYLTSAPTSPLSLPNTPTPPSSLPATYPLPTSHHSQPVVHHASPTPTTNPSPTITPTPFATLDSSLPTPAIPIPTPVPPFPRLPDTTYIALLGNDIDWAQGGRTDTIILVAINHDAQTATMLSLPRDLYVYIPGWKMDRLNLVLPHGNGSDYPGEGGGLLRDTILYNFGIPLDYYIRIGFGGFREVVDLLGGVELVVNCPLNDWRLKSPELDPQVEENWEIFTLNTGVVEMDGDLALWYARSRRTTNDFERGRRQQQLLQAMLRKGVSLELVEELPALWQSYQSYVETNLTLPTMLQLATLAPAVRQNGIHHYSLAGDALQAWRAPETGSQVQLLQWDFAQPVFSQFMQNSALHQGQRHSLTVEVFTNDGILYRQLAENLAWFGFVAVYGGIAPSLSQTEVSYNGTTFKGSQRDILAWVLDMPADAVQLSTDLTYDYRLYLHTDYNPCRPLLYAPPPENNE